MVTWRRSPRAARIQKVRASISGVSSSTRVERWRTLAKNGESRQHRWYAAARRTSSTSCRRSRSVCSCCGRTTACSPARVDSDASTRVGKRPVAFASGARRPRKHDAQVRPIKNHYEYGLKEKQRWRQLGCDSKVAQIAQEAPAGPDAVEKDAHASTRVERTAGENLGTSRRPGGRRQRWRRSKSQRWSTRPETTRHLRVRRQKSMP